MSYRQPSKKNKTPKAAKRANRTKRPKSSLRLLGRSLLGLLILVGIWLAATLFQLQGASTSPVGAFLVLGGSIQREIYVAELAKQQPQIPILISQGSPEPCIWSIFQRTNASIQQVWLEKCADSTFGNFYYSLPILQEWQVRKVKLLTSQTHLPRAQWLAQIMLGSHGIWVETEVVPEQGIPGNRETPIKTSLDVVRSLGWAVLSQFYAPHCSAIQALQTVDMPTWRKRGFHCEHQGNIEG